MDDTVCYYCLTDNPPEFILMHKSCLRQLQNERKHLQEDNDILLMRLTDCTRIMDSLRAKRDELQAEIEKENKK